MIQVPFIQVPVLALCCYAFLLVALLATKKNPQINSFMGLLVCYALWTAGSMLMRLGIYPGWGFWYEVSLLSLFLVPLLLYNFIHSFVENKNYGLKKLWLICTVIIVILTHFGVFLKPPVIVDLGNGQNVFRYSTTWVLAIPCVVFFFILLSSFLLIINARKNNKVSAAWLPPIVLGMTALFIGNVLSVLPGNYFPWDTLSGIINAGLMFYALYKKRLLKLILLVSRGTLLGASAAIVSVAFSYWLNQLESLIAAYFPQLVPYRTLTMALVFTAITLLFYKLLNKVMDNLFIRDEQVQARQLNIFSLKISKSLNVEEIIDELIDVVKNVLDVEKAYVCLADATGENYTSIRASSPLDMKKITLSVGNPCIVWLRSNENCLILRDFQRTTLYKSMWEQEKKQLAELHIECIVPLKCDSGLAGVLLLSKKSKGSYQPANITFLESVESIVSIAINNATLYQKAYYEARIDPLTNLFNRKSFYEKLQEEFSRSKDHSLALVFLNLDDFKLYNQLYGNYDGDLALQRVARIISTCVGTSGTVARYEGKEFALILPYYDTMKALNLANEIKRQISVINTDFSGTTLKVLTLSGGICVYPYAASNVEQLISNADMAVYNAKRSGKNKIVVYSLGKTLDPVQKGPDGFSGGNYAEYAPTIYALTAAIDAKDHYTFSHSQNVAEYATTLATQIGLNKEHIQIIYEAALLHDIGKISIPENILSKPGRLTSDEYKLMKKHVENSIAIIRHLPSLDYVIPAAIGHHERWDGKGYPRGIKGEDIPLSARCLAIADAFDAMTAVRSYKKRMPVEFALNELISNARTQFDPDLVMVFVDLIKTGKINVRESCATIVKGETVKEDLLTFEEITA